MILSNDNNSPDYDLVFKQLVLDATEEDKLIGLLAYSEWRVDLSEGHQHLSASRPLTDRELKGYRRDALDIYQSLIDRAAQKEIRKVKTNYWTPVGQSIVASTVFALGLLLIGLIIRFAAPDSNPGQLVKFFFASDQYKLCVIDKNKADGIDTKKCFP